MVREHMVRVGIRELRQQARALLQRVEAGERFEITVRGRPIAVLGPVTSQRPLARLRASGAITEARGDVDALPAPIPLGPGQEAPSRVLTRLRGPR